MSVLHILLILSLFSVAFVIETNVNAQHYFVKYTANNCSNVDINGLYIEQDFHRIPEQFQNLQNKLENDVIYMWRKHSGNHFRVWFQNENGYTLYHDALDMKWHLVDNEWQSIYLHKDTHHHEDGEQAGSHKTELPPLDGYICDPKYKGDCGTPPIFHRKYNQEPSGLFRQEHQEL